MSRVDIYREALRNLENWDAYLLKESGLPGRRANIELAHAVAEEGGEEVFKRYLTYVVKKAPVNSPYEFLAFCGVLGMGRTLSEGNRETLNILRSYASDPRWRIREAVALALQRLGEVNMEVLLQEMKKWSQGNALEKRAAASALCEPKLLQGRNDILAVLQILNDITGSIHSIKNRKSEDFKALRKGLGYCWSVAVAAYPEKGKKMMERWFSTDDKDVLWIMKENLRKNRLTLMDEGWVKKCKVTLAMK